MSRLPSAAIERIHTLTSPSFLRLILCSGSGILGVTIGLNALSKHGTCTVTFSVVAAIVVIAAASFRKFQQIGILTWIGFISIFVAVFIIVVAVTTQDRPAAAPTTGDYDLGFKAIPSGVTFAAGVVASCTIFVSSAGTCARHNQWIPADASHSDLSIPACDQ